MLDLDGAVQGGFITTDGSVVGNISITGPLSGPTVSAGAIGSVVNLNGALQGGFITTDGSVTGTITIGGPMSGPALSAESPAAVINVNGPVEGGSITTYGSATGAITVNGTVTGPTGLAGSIGGADKLARPAGAAPVTTPTGSAGSTGGTIAVNAPVKGGSILTGGSLGNLTIGGTLSGQVVTIGNMNGIVEISGPVQNCVIATSGSINGSVTIGGPLSGGQILSEGNVNGNLVIKGLLQNGRIAALGSILGNVMITGGIDSGSALVSGGSIGGPTGKLSVGNINGIVAAVGRINVGQIGSTSQALFYGQNIPAIDGAVVDSIFSQGLLPPLGPSDQFDHAAVLDLDNLALILANLESLTVKNGKLQL